MSISWLKKLFNKNNSQLVSRDERFSVYITSEPQIPPTCKYIVRNDNLKSIIVVIEPWAEEFTLQPKGKMEMNINFTKSGIAETQICDPYVSIWLWGDSTATVLIDGIDCTPESLKFN